MRCLKSIIFILYIRWWLKVTHIEIRHRSANTNPAEHSLLRRQPSSRRLLYSELLNGQRLPKRPKLRFNDRIRCALSQCNIPLSDLESTANDRNR